MNHKNKIGTLIIARHGESEWNTVGKWTGWTDVSLTKKGRQDAAMLGKEFLIGQVFDYIYTSDLKRTYETLDAMMEGALNPIRATDPSVVHAQELRERDYGIYTGKDKWQVKQEVSEEVFTGIRRGWDYPIPEGENLKQVYDRVVPYFRHEIEPKLHTGEKVLVVAHGNSIRALIKYLEAIDDQAIADVEMPLGHLLIYEFDAAHQQPVSKRDLAIDVGQTKA